MYYFIIIIISFPITCDCIGRTPVHSSIQKLKPLMTPLSDSNWLSKETPPTPYCEFVSSEGSDDNSSSPPPLIDL